MSPHQSRKFGCQRSRARWSLRSDARSTLFGIFASKSIFGRAEVMVGSHSLLVEVGLAPRAVAAQRTLRSRGVGADEDPVLPGGQAAEDPRLHRLRADEAVVRLHAGEGVRAQGGALLEEDADLVLVVDVVGGVGDQAGLLGLRAGEARAGLERRERLVVAVAAGLQAGEAVAHRERAEVRGGEDELGRVLLLVVVLERALEHVLPV